MNPVEKSLLDKSPALVEVLDFFVLVTIPDLLAFACTVGLAEDLELASLGKRAVVLLCLDVVMAGYLRERQLKVKAVMLAGKTSCLRKQEKCSVEEEILQDSVEQSVEMDDFL